MIDNNINTLRGALFSGIASVLFACATQVNAQMPQDLSAPGGYDAGYEDYSDPGVSYTEEDWGNDKQEIQRVFNEEQQRLYKIIDDNTTMDRVVNLKLKPGIRSRLNQPALGNFKLLRAPGITINWDNYSRDPSLTKEEILENVRLEAEAYAQREVRPEERKAVIPDEAEKRYKMYKKGDKVSLILRGGRGDNVFVENLPFVEINEEVVQLGRRLIIRSDLSELDVAKFYEDVNVKAKQAYIIANQNKIDMEYDSAVAKYMQNKLPETLVSSGYVPDIKKEYASLRTSKLEYWMSKKELVQRMRKDLIDMARATVDNVTMPEYMRSKGYIYYPTLDGKGEEWINESEKARREALKNGYQGGMGDPMMMDPGMMGPPPGMR